MVTDNDDKNNFFSDIVTSFDFIKFLLNENMNITPLQPGTVLDLNLIKVKTVLFPNIYVSIFTTNKSEIDLLTNIYSTSKLLGIVSLNSKNNKLYKVGTTAQILKLVRINDDKVQLILQGVDRFKIQKSEVKDGINTSTVEIIGDNEVDVESDDFKNKKDAYISIIKDLLEKLIDNQNITPELRFFIEKNNDLVLLIYIIASSISINNSNKQKILEETDIFERGSLLIKFLKNEIEFAELKKKVNSKAQDSINKRQKEYFIKQQIEALKEELNKIGSNWSVDFDDDIEVLRDKLSKKKLGKKTKEFIEKLLKKAEKATPNSVDYMLLVNQAEFILELPWNNYSKGNIKLDKAKDILDENHYGMDKIKDKILEYLSIYKMRDQKTFGDILCFLGPPGVGKTSLCRSIAKALNREYVKISLGGIDDEAEIRGHRKTYIGAMAGRILKGLQHLKTSNPVVVLDEIDKMTKLQGDPAAALLEVLDTDQNKEFIDHYVETPYDLSKIMFICTANDYSGIPNALRDRLEIIEVSGYAMEEKLQIAKNYIIPKLIEENGLKDKNISFTDECINKIIENHTRESGVRELKRQLKNVIFKLAKNIVSDEKYDNVIDVNNLEHYLGIIKYDGEHLDELNKPGVAIGLAWTSVGGDVLFLESVKMKGDGKLMLTGKLGDVMKESANLAFDYIKSHVDDLNIDENLFKQNDFHIHVPDGATPKDGPSAGITLFSTLYSLLINKPIKNYTAMTGEITLRGRVTAVGGIREKILAAKRAGVKNIIMCKDNQKDVSEIKKDYIEGLNFIYISDVKEIPKLIF